MRRRFLYLVAILGITVAAGAGIQPAESEAEESHLWIIVNPTDAKLPEQITMAVGEVIEFQPVGGRQSIRVQGGDGVLGDSSSLQYAVFVEGKLEFYGRGAVEKALKAKKVGKAKIEVTTHLGGTRREIREFEITVVDKRKEKLPVKEPMPIGPYSSLTPDIGAPGMPSSSYGPPAVNLYGPPSSGR